MISYEKAQNVVSMIEGELWNEGGGYAYMTFDGMCKDFDITPKDYADFIYDSLDLIRKSEESSLTNRKDGAYLSKTTYKGEKKMQKLEIEYLKRNGFKLVGKDGGFESWMIDEFKLVDEGFSDKRQRSLVHAQFGDRIQDVERLGFMVKPVNEREYDVTMHWLYRDGAKSVIHSSTIGGEDLYDLVSQAIVLADVDGDLT